MLKKKLILSLIGFYIFWLLVLPSIVSKTIEIVCRKVSYNSNYEIQIDNLKSKSSILPVGTITADDVIIKAKKKSLVFQIDGFKFRFRFLPLLSGRLHINNIELGKIYLSTNIDDKFELDKDFFEKFKHRFFRVDSVKIQEFNAEFYQNDIKEPIIYKGRNFDFQRKNRYVKLHNDSILVVDGKTSRVTSNLFLPKDNDIKKTVFDVGISNIDISPFKNYFKHYLPQDLLALNGIVNVVANKEECIINLNTFSVRMADYAKSIFFPEQMIIKSKFNINRNYINFENIDIESENIHANIRGKVFDYFGKSMPSLDMSIVLNKSNVEDIINLLPVFKLEEIDIYKLKKYKFFGQVLANFSIKGRLPEPNLVGDIYINNGVLVKPISNTSMGATIKLKLAERLINFDVVIPTGGLEKVWVKGTQELYNIKYADLTVKSTNSVDLKTAQDLLKPLHEILNFIIGPLPIMEIAGKGNIDISVKGNRKNPHIWGVFNIKNSTVGFDALPEVKIENSDAVLKFNNQNVNFTLLKGDINKKNALISGNCNLYGDFNFDISSSEQPLEKLYFNIIKSEMIPDILKKMPKLDLAKGLVDFKIKVYGSVKHINDIEFNKNIFAKGEVVLKDNSFAFHNITIDKANGKILFGTTSADADILAKIGNLPLSFKSKIKGQNADLIVDIPKLNPNFLISNAVTRNKQYLPYVAVKGKYNGNIENIEYDKLNFKAVILDSILGSKIHYNSGGIITVVNNKISIQDVSGFIDNHLNTFDVNLNIDNAFLKPDANGTLKIKTPDLSLFNEVLAINLIPENLRKYVKDYEFKKGELNLNARIVNNKLTAFSDLSGISFVYLPLNMPVDIVNGRFLLRNNTLKFNKINLLADNMPVLVDGEIKDIFDKKNFNLYFNSKPQQEFIDKYINKNQIYPIKIKGDIVYWVKLKGILDNFDLKAQVNMNKNSSLYYFGATIGDIENAIVVAIDSKITKGNNYKIKEFSYDKLVDSLSGRKTQLNMLKAWGGVQISKEDLNFDDLRIKTSHPTDARIFNIIFRKPNIKQGQFTSDLKFNGKLSDLKVLGDFHIFETDIPFLDTTMKNIELVFKDKFIMFNSKGDIIGNDIVFEGVLKNKLTIPYRIEKANFYAKNLNLNQLIDKLKVAEVDSVSTFESLEDFNLRTIIAKNFVLKADAVQLRNIHATNFEAETSLNEKGVFDVNNFRFNIAQGLLEGNLAYNLENNAMGINLDANSISANDLTLALFDLNNQIHGDLTGKVGLNCEGTDFNHCMQTLNGNAIFNVKDGKMPKLGSLEYLLKAGNLVKGGLTGLSINGIVDLLAPSKTGEFENIYGSVRIKDGVARNIEIATKGNDLNLFVSGSYNFATSIADMEVLGLLSRKISTMLGPIGNVSINTLFNIIPGVDLSKDSPILERINKIPGVELSDKLYRKFIAEIKGNINGEDYVTSFKWIN